jgi:hypothetical protein
MAHKNPKAKLPRKMEKILELAFGNPAIDSNMG